MSSLRSRSGGSDERNDIQAVIEILPETALLDLLCQVPVRGGDHPDIHLDRPGAPQRLELLLLEDPQELRLEGRAHLAHLVEEDRPPVGELKPPLAAGDGAGEGPLLMAEELALQERLRKGGAGDLDKGLLRPGGCCDGWRWRSPPSPSRSPP